MKVEIHINGQIQIEHTPETDLERLVLTQIVDQYEKGAPVKVERRGETVIFGVEK